MKALFYAPWAAGVFWGIAFFAVQPWQSSAQTVTTNDIRIESIEGKVEVNPGGNTQWQPALQGRVVKPGDRVRTRERSTVSIRWSDQSVVRLPEISDVQIQGSAADQRTSLAAQPRQSPAPTVTPQAPAGEIYIESVEGVVEVNPGGNTQWQRTFSGRVLKPGDRVRTRERSTVSIHWSDQSRARLPELSDVQILPAAAPQRTSFSLITGLLSFFNRERLTNARFGTRTASAAIRGTEFVLQAEENGRTTLTVIEGEVELSNEVGGVTLRTREQGVAEPGQQPRKTATIIVNNVIQWALYYPAVLDVDELGLTLAERTRLATSLAAYKSGELLRALELLPTPVAAESSGEKIYRAGLLLAVGNVAEAEQVLDTVAQTAGAAAAAPRSLRLADALRTLIAAVKLEPSNTNSVPELASEWLAESYSLQSRGDLSGALRAARKSIDVSADFGFGWTRVAELEFSFGHTREALDALERGLLYSPRNAQALALKGFVLAAQNRISEAISWFNRAITVDPNLANAWLGRGLCLIRQGHSQRGREDLLTAVVMEPQRAVLRSYLAKAYTDAGDEKRATHELQIAKDIDPNDPTAWLYSALLNEQENRINDAIRDLEKSQEFTGNRQIYRSDLLLDQDRAVRSANLARIYQDAGMFDVAIREASRAVSYDYANYSAHLFLANSYDTLRDPNRINLRYETPALAEYLTANLLAPVGAGLLSSTISQQEYSKLFEQDRFGIASSTEVLSRGAWTQGGAQYGRSKNTAYSFEAFYRTDPGQRVNNDFEERVLSLKLKHQFTAHDSLYAEAIYYEASGGDLIQRYDPGPSLGTAPVIDPALPTPGFRFKENHDPTLHLGYHREWTPGSHTLFLGSRLNARQSSRNLFHPTFFINREDGVLEVVERMSANMQYRTSLEIYSGELQQIWEKPRSTTIVGLRYQQGSFQTTNFQTFPLITEHSDFFDPDNPAAQQDIETDLKRASVYALQRWQVLESVSLFGGVTYDWIEFPLNFNAPPISNMQGDRDQISPKAGLIWLLGSNTVARGAYTRSLGGVSLDQSARIEPTAVAGFNQAFRSIQPEAHGGSLIGVQFTTYGVSLEHRFPTRLYVGVTAERLESDQSGPLGAFQSNPFPPGYPPFLSSLDREMDHRENTLLLTVNQLLGDEWALGAAYRLTESKLNVFFPDVQPDAPRGDFRPDQKLRATLHNVTLHSIYNHPSGFFAKGEAVWYGQTSAGFLNPQKNESLWQFNMFAGVRLQQRSIELLFGILNLAAQDYKLEPLTPYMDLPRDRTFVTRLRLSF